MGNIVKFRGVMELNPVEKDSAGDSSHSVWRAPMKNPGFTDILHAALLPILPKVLRGSLSIFKRVEDLRYTALSSAAASDFPRIQHRDLCRTMN